MLLIPTEKRLDWRRAPVVLFAIAVLNVLVFVVYQSGDVAKSQEVLQSYKQMGYFEKEWPAYLEFLKARNKGKRIEALEARYESGVDDGLLFEVLTDTNFYQYLHLNGRRVFSQAYYEEWREPRKRLNETIKSLSWMAGGLSRNDFNVFNLLSHQFLHGDVMHLMSNLFFLLICGFAVEAALGPLKFLALYLVCGVISGAAQIFIIQDTKILIGASGAISGVMAMYLGIFRLKKIEFFYWIFFLVGYFRAPALFILPAYIFKELVFFVSDPSSGIAYVAHIGGFVCGAAVVGAILKFKPELLDDDYVEEDQTVDPRQQALAEIYTAIEKYQFITARDLVEELIEKEGADFELVSLRYNLLKLENDPQKISAAKSLVLMTKLMPYELKKVDQVWREEHPHGLDIRPEQQMNLGIRLVNLPEPTTAAQLFDELHSCGFQHALMGVLAKKLSQAYERIQLREKQNHYKEIADELLGAGF